MEVEICQFFNFDLPHFTFYDHVTEFLVIGCLLPDDKINLRKLFDEDFSVGNEQNTEVYQNMVPGIQKKVERKLRENSIDVMETILEFYDTDPDSQREIAYLILVTARELSYVLQPHCLELLSKFNIFVKSEQRFLAAKDLIMANFEDSVSEEEVYSIERETEEESYMTHEKQLDEYKMSSINPDIVQTNRSRDTSYDSSSSDSHNVYKENSEEVRSPYCSPNDTDYKIDLKDTSKFNFSKKVNKNEIEGFNSTSQYISPVNFDIELMEEPQKEYRDEIEIMETRKSKSTIKIKPKKAEILAPKNNNKITKVSNKRRISQIMSSYNNLNSLMQKENNFNLRTSVSPKIENIFKMKDNLSKTSRPTVDYSWKVEPHEPLMSSFRSPDSKVLDLKKSLKNLTLAKSYAFEGSQFSQLKRSSNQKSKSKRKRSLESKNLTDMIRSSKKKEQNAWPLKRLQTFKDNLEATKVNLDLKSFDFAPKNNLKNSKKKELIKEKSPNNDKRRISMSPNLKNTLKNAMKKTLNTLTSKKLTTFATNKFSMIDDNNNVSPTKFSKLSSSSIFDSIALQKKRKKIEESTKKKDWKAKLNSIRSKLSYKSPDKKKDDGTIIPKTSRISSIKSTKICYKNIQNSALTDRGVKSRGNSKQMRKFQVECVRKILDKSTGFNKLKSSLINSSKSYKQQPEIEHTNDELDRKKKISDMELMFKTNISKVKSREGSVTKIKNSKIMSLLRKKRSRDILKQFDKNNEKDASSRKLSSFLKNKISSPPNIDQIKTYRDTRKRDKSKTEIGLLSSRFKKSYFDNGKAKEKNQSSFIQRSQILTGKIKKIENSGSKFKENFNEIIYGSRSGSNGSGGKKFKQSYLQKIYGLQENIFDNEISTFEMYR